MKAQLLREYLQCCGYAGEFIAPDLPHWPGRALAGLESEIRRRDPQTITLIGSSLGGHYATWLAEKHTLRAVLVNPAVNPHLLLAQALGPLKNIYTGEEYRFTPKHLRELEQTHIAVITRPERYLLLVQTGDEVLDYRHALDKYRGAKQRVIEGGDHGFQNFSVHIPLILEFAGK